MFKNFDTSSFKKMKPPGDNSFDTMQEVKELNKIPLNKKYVKDYDNIEAAFKKTADENGVKNYDKKLVSNLVEKSAPVILKLKKHFNRPRPNVSAKKMKVNMKHIEMASMKTPSYPSGHSAQGMLIGKVLAGEHPTAREAFHQTAKNISYSRRVAHAHYKSDSDMGEKLGIAMAGHIKKK